MSAELWADNPELQKRFEAIQAQTRQLQKELGIEPKTLEQRQKEYRQRRQQEFARQQELERQRLEFERFRSIPKPPIPLRRPGK